MNPRQGAPKTTRLADLAAVFDSAELVRATETYTPKFEAGGVWTMPHISYPPVVDELIRLAYEDDWVRRDLDWPTWTTTAEAQDLIDDPGAVDRAGIEQLARLLTALVRQERFSDGAILGALESGLLQRVLERIRTLDRGESP